MHAQLLTGAAPIRSALQDRTVASRLAGIVARRHAGPRFSPSARCAAILHRGLMTLASTDDRDALNSLLAATAQRDQRAFAELYRRTSPKLYGICLRVLRTRGEADEVLQDVYTSVWNRAATFDAAKAGALTWLGTLARNRAIDRLRQHREDTRESGDADERVDDDATPALAAERSQEHRRLAECMDRLEPTQRTSVRDAFFTGATYNELAARLGVPLGTMKSWIRRSLIQLRTCLEA